MRTMAETTTHDRLLTYAEAGERICGINADAVAALVRQGALSARVLVVRGKNKRPRKGVMASEVARYLRTLPEPDAKGRAPAGRARPMRVNDAALRKELESMVRYV